ncbi:IPT/TIG domain-containing protein [Streptomyces sp. NPDC086787]|uniref:IPT/TIG domain-containing protein n=1 Tax=Streptomyces sp. NPDC086787 TaxID=3365759 RepID=UPI003823FE16
MAPPVVSSVSPNQGPPLGGTPVTITGSGFTGATLVRFGANPATNVIVVNNTQITATTPSGSGTVNVSVTTPGGTSSQTVPFTYTSAGIPTLTSLSPTAGPAAGGNTVTLNGTGLNGATSIRFGANPATNVIVVNSTQITATAPTSTCAGTVNVTVTTPVGTSNPLPYIYLAAPTVIDLTRHFGPSTGANTVVIFGTGLSLTSAVSFGANPATGITVVSDNQLTVTAPAGTGTVTVTVSTPGGTSIPNGDTYYTYLAAPVIQTLTPSHGPDTGGNSTVLTGTNLTYTDTVTFGGVPAMFAAISDTQVVATVPGGPPGTVNVMAHTPGGNSNLLPYLYEVS